MLTIHPQVKIYLHSAPIDMRKSFDGLYDMLTKPHREIVDNNAFFELVGNRCCIDSQAARRLNEVIKSVIHFRI